MSDDASLKSSVCERGGGKIFRGDTTAPSAHELTTVYWHQNNQSLK